MKGKNQVVTKQENDLSSLRDNFFIYLKEARKGHLEWPFLILGTYIPSLRSLTDIDSHIIQFCLKMSSPTKIAWDLVQKHLGTNYPKYSKANWGKLSVPYVCGLLATNPSQASAKLHNTGFKTLNLPFHYHAFKVKDLTVPINAMREMGFRAYSVTIPFKEDALKFVDEITPVAKDTGAINTIINSGDKLVGYNTDWLGVLGALLEVKESYVGESALIIGAGGAARGATYALKKLKFKKIMVANRTIRRAKELAEEFDIDAIQLSSLSKNLVASYSVIINATPEPYLEHFPYEVLSDEHIVLEMITRETDLTNLAQKNGAVVIHGLRMLLYQGLVQFKLFTEKEPPVEEMDAIMR